ncbi:MAG: thioredoxin-like domain-containing protein [Pirellulales bacterium]
MWTVCWSSVGQAVAQTPAVPTSNPFGDISKNKVLTAFQTTPGVEIQWLNTGRPLEPQQLRGKFVMLDFWTYCCINCMHILPELKKLEHAYPNELVVIGVHSAKFDNERDTKNITEAILRYEIEHPVANDNKMAIWNEFYVNSWPSLVLIDPDGRIVGRHSGEFTFEQLNPLLSKAVAYYKAAGKIDPKPLDLVREDSKVKDTPLRFPGKVIADVPGNRLFIADSNHNRIVVTDLAGKLLETIGNGAIGFAGGAYDKATFNHPQGMVLAGDVLYVADTENHMLRKVDLKAKTVNVVAGTGVQGRNPFPGITPQSTSLPRRYVGKPRLTELNSPWDLWVHEKDLYIAMAGPHQIWKMPLSENEIGPFAGNAREDIIDGNHMPREPYGEGVSSFAQPSGLTSDGKVLYVADSEGSSIRAVPFDPKKSVYTPLGTAMLPQGRLFDFGDRDGPVSSAKLQHPLGVAYRDGMVYIADTYNNKIKVLDLAKNECRTIAGAHEPGDTDEPAKFDEPAGLSLGGDFLYVADTNNHAIRTIDLKNGHKVATLKIDGLVPPPKAGAAKK